MVSFPSNKLEGNFFSEFSFERKFGMYSTVGIKNKTRKLISTWMDFRLPMFPVA